MSRARSLGVALALALACVPALAGTTSGGAGPNGNLSPISNTLASNVALTTQGTFFDGPSVAQGSAGTWFASGTVTLWDSTTQNLFQCKLWDGTTIIASSGLSATAQWYGTISLSGRIAAPAGNLRISCAGASTTTGIIASSGVGSGATSSTITAFRIG